MFIANCQEYEITGALAWIQPQFGYNLKFLRFRAVTQPFKGFALALITCTKGGKGSRTTEFGAPTNRACWHAIGTFIDALPKKAQVKTFDGWTRPGEPWPDYYGSATYNPPHIRTLCRCEMKIDEAKEHVIAEIEWEYADASVTRYGPPLDNYSIEDLTFHLFNIRAKRERGEWGVK